MRSSRSHRTVPPPTSSVAQSDDPSDRNGHPVRYRRGVPSRSRTSVAPRTVAASLPSLAPPPGLRADAARNRARVLSVARDSLTAGDTTLAMNVLARSAGMGVGTVYRHFPTRQFLLETLAADSFERLLAVARTAAEEDDAGRGLAQLLRAAVQCLLDDVCLGAVLRSGEVACAETTQVLGDLLAVFGGLLTRAREAGAIRPETTPGDLRRYLLGLELAVRLHDRGGGPDPEQVDRDVEVLLTGLRPTG